MFEDLLSETGIDTSNPTQVSTEDRNKHYILNLLLDVENTLAELQNEIYNLGGKCVYCSAVEGELHTPVCTFRSVRLRVSSEVDRYV